MNITLFLGAGFSRAFGLPVMREFFDYLNDEKGIAEADKERVRALRRKAREASSMLDGTHDNLEHVLSLALMAPEVEVGERGALSAYDHLSVVLQKIYGRIQLEWYAQLRESLAVLLGFERSSIWGHNLTVITTNYDLLAEFGLWSLGLPPRLPFEWQSEQRSPNGASLYSDDMNGPLLCKLHGSLNWYKAPSPPALLRVVDGVVRVRGPMRRSEGDWYLPQMSTADGLQALGTEVPIIVPPTLYKQQAGAAFKRTWDAAHSALRQANRLVVIGYSFPQSDTYMKYFLASALVDNIDLPKIEVVDPAANQIVERLRSSDFGSHFKQLLHAVPQSSWRDHRFSVLR